MGRGRCSTHLARTCKGQRHWPSGVDLPTGDRTRSSPDVIYNCLTILKQLRHPLTHGSASVRPEVQTLWNGNQC